MKCEEKLLVADEAEPDQKTMENLVALQDEVESMKRQMDYVEDFGHALLADGAASDVRHIEAALVTARERYDELEGKIGDSITFLEGNGPFWPFLFFRSTESFYSNFKANPSSIEDAVPQLSLWSCVEFVVQFGMFSSFEDSEIIQSQFQLLF